MSDTLRTFTPEVSSVKAMPANWEALTIAEVRRVQDEFRKIPRVD